MAQREICDYTVIYCSGSSLNDFIGEHDEHPAKELEKISSKGWESAMFCEYPQEIIIQFKEVVNIIEIQILSHQYEIPTRIDLYSYIPSVPLELAPINKLDELDFRRIGHITFDSNEITGHLARELKSIYVAFEAYMIKLKMPICYYSKQNVGNQVGIVSLKCIKSSISKKRKIYFEDLIDTPVSIQQIPERKSTVDELNREPQIDIDPIIKDKINGINKKKIEAVKIEDFDEAARLAKIVSKLEELGCDLKQLEISKKEAILNEDYKLAKEYKLEIENIRKRELERIMLAAAQELAKRKLKPYIVPRLPPRKTNKPAKAWWERNSLPKKQKYLRAKKKQEEKKDNYFDILKAQSLIKEDLKETERIMKLVEPYKGIFDLTLLKCLFSNNNELKKSGLDDILLEITYRQYSKILTSDTTKLLNALVEITVNIMKTKDSMLCNVSLTVLLVFLTQYKTEAIVKDFIDKLFEEFDNNSEIIKKNLIEFLKRGIISVELLIESLKRNKKYRMKYCKLITEIAKICDSDKIKQYSKEITDYGSLCIKFENENIKSESEELTEELSSLVGNMKIENENK